MSTSRRGAGLGAAVDAWVAQTGGELEEMRMMNQLWTAPRDVAAREQMRRHIDAAERDVAVVEEQTRQIQDYIRGGQMQHLRMKNLASRAAAQAARIDSIRGHLPPAIAETFDALLVAPPTPPAAATAATPAATGTPGARTPVAETPPETPPPRTGSRAFPLVAMVTEDELDAAPQYVKGRLTLKKIEDVVEKLNAFVVEKYTLLKQSKRDLNGEERKRWEAFHESECPEAKGETFVTDAEIKKLSSVKLNPTANQAINVLRHIGALKEVRGRNKVRIFIIREPGSH